MPADDDLVYYLARAAQEHIRAAQCDDSGVASAHRELAELYEQRAAELGSETAAPGAKPR